MIKKILYSLFFVNFFCVFEVCAYKKCNYTIIGEGNDTSIYKNETLNWHSKYRTMALDGVINCQPQADSKAMNMLSWNERLALEALKVSKTCIFEHVKVQMDEFPEGVGQNLYRSCTNKRRKPTWEKAILHWFNENELYNFPDTPVPSNGHYTQLIWGESKFLGCGYCEFMRENTSKTPYCTLYVCHYGPAGNIKGEPPYKPVSLDYKCDRPNKT